MSQEPTGIDDGGFILLIIAAIGMGVLLALAALGGMFSECTTTPRKALAGIWYLFYLGGGIGLLGMGGGYMIHRYESSGPYRSISRAGKKITLFGMVILIVVMVGTTVFLETVGLPNCTVTISEVAASYWPF